MSRRSRRRQSAGLRLPLIAFVALLLVGAGAWWWSQRDDAPDTTAAVATREGGDPQRTESTHDFSATQQIERVGQRAAEHQATTEREVARRAGPTQVVRHRQGKAGVA